jgi:hypothetical protein
VVRGNRAATFSGKVSQAERFFHFVDDLGVVDLAFLPDLYVDLWIETTEKGSTIRFERSPYGGDLELTDIPRERMPNRADPV